MLGDFPSHNGKEVKRRFGKDEYMVTLCKSETWLKEEGETYGKKENERVKGTDTAVNTS